MNNSKPTKVCSTTTLPNEVLCSPPRPHLSQHQHLKGLEPLEGDPAKQQCAKASHHPEAAAKLSPMVFLWSDFAAQNCSLIYSKGFV